MSNRPLPPCGLYQTTAPIGDVPAGRLVYFHNHGEPGPGVYLPREWRGNRAHFHERGTPLQRPDEAQTLLPLSEEGFYRVAEAFFCCDNACQRFEAESLVQLGYDGQAGAILFTPELVDDALVVPERGTRIDGERVGKLRALRVPTRDGGDHAGGEGGVVH